MGERKGRGRWSHPTTVFHLLFLQRSLYSGLQSPGAPGPALGSFAFLPSGSTGASNRV